MAAEAGIARSFGVCNTMGTASTMASLVETMGLSLPMNASLPAADSRRMALAHLSGMRIVRMVEEDLKISRVVSRNSFENAVIANAAFGGSTNAVVHLLALAKRLEIPFDLQDFELGADIPLLVNCMPSGTYLMEDFCYAGGVPVVLKELSHLLRDALTITGACIKEVVADAECFNTDVIRSFNSPVKEKAGIRVLRGNLVPNGAVIKPAAANENLLKHEGQALVFSSIEDMRARINDPALPVTADTVLVLQGCGPRGYPGMAEVGNLPIPARLLEAGVRDMVRISDARMSGTAYGTVVLHASPEAAVGGPIALVQSGDTIRLDVAGGSLELLVDEAELARRRANWVEPQVQADRGYLRLYQDHVLQAEEGADLDFLVGRSGASVSREAH
ncbi:dihydroxy-acid dehydratase [Paracoccus versutus]|uniref:Dihydroxy-acid dehydratase n=2 Tax=Paracoccus versutus TaxID=34007 RepID=A0AAQ0KNA1_PARVE|nr:dihydroxy-acid dehydratase [Paracoccus versutus]